jgi:hypothetical protein
MTGCIHRRYQSDRSLKMLHIFGIGWVMERCGTNATRVFGIGSIDATMMRALVETNAPSSIEPMKSDK